jgi:hypothetical protein
MDMIDRLVNTLFRWGRLREALFAEVHLYDYLDKIMADPESMKTGASYWPDIDGWRGWSQDEETNKYYFNDVPEENCMDAIKALEEMNA